MKTEMASKSRRKKYRPGQGATPLDPCFAANLTKTMEAIQSGLDCVEKSGKILQWTDTSMALSAARVEGANDRIRREEQSAMSEEQ